MKNFCKLNILLITLILLLSSKELLPQAGQLDTTFGQGGIITSSLNTRSDIYLTSAVIQGDGKIVAVGFIIDDYVLARYNKDGSQDNTFGTNGIVSTPFASAVIASSVVIQQDGKIVTAGYSGNAFILVRYNSNGALDTTFGTNGVAAMVIGTSNSQINSVTVQSDGKLVAAGTSDADHFTIVRYNSDGSLDNTFGTNGILSTQIGIGTNFVNTVAIQSDGKIVVAGSARFGYVYVFTMIRFNPNGAFDNSFGTNGVVTTLVDSSNSYILSIAIQNDGKLVAAGYSVGVVHKIVSLARYNPSGTLDNTFGTNGIVRTTIGSYNAEVYSIAIQSDGKLVVAGDSYNGSNYDFLVVPIILTEL